ncbi:MAG: fatty acid desaturase [Planctomycetota bacterium]|nr:fatty acid desaturase [Planctomycetota bacterium]
MLSSAAANDRLGMLCSLLTLLPHQAFIRGHRAHHRFAGNRSGLDPTGPRVIPDRIWLHLLLRLRIIPFLFYAGVYFPYFFHDYFPTVGRRCFRHLLGTLASILAIHLWIGVLLQTPWQYPLFVLLAHVFHGIYYEHLFTQNQHAGLLPDSSRSVFRYREQGNFSRSVETPFARWLLYFNLHKEHHLYPNANYRLLPILHELIEKKYPEILEYTSRDTGPVRVKPGDGRSLGFPLAGVRVAVRYDDPSQQLGQLFVQTVFGSRLTCDQGQPAWFPTGDLVQVRHDEIFYLGRRSERTAASGFGENMSTGEIENRFLEETGQFLVCLDGGVSDGLVALVFAVKPDDTCPWIRELDHCNALAAKKAKLNCGPALRIDSVACVEKACPLTASGKVDLAQVRREHAALISTLAQWRA